MVYKPRQEHPLLRRPRSERKLRARWKIDTYKKRRKAYGLNTDAPNMYRAEERTFRKLYNDLDPHLRHLDKERMGEFGRYIPEDPKDMKICNLVSECCELSSRRTAAVWTEHARKRKLREKKRRRNMMSTRSVAMSS